MLKRVKDFDKDKDKLKMAKISKEREKMLEQKHIDVD